LCRFSVAIPKYSSEYYYISEDDYEKLEEDGLVKEKEKDARKISKLNKGPTFMLQVVQFVSKMSIAKNKSDLIFKAVPILFIAIFAGSLFTYRFHMQIVRDLSMKRTDLLIDVAKLEETSNNAINSDN